MRLFITRRPAICQVNLSLSAIKHPDRRQARPTVSWQQQTLEVCQKCRASTNLVEADDNLDAAALRRAGIGHTPSDASIEMWRASTGEHGKQPTESLGSLGRTRSPVPQSA